MNDIQNLDNSSFRNDSGNKTLNNLNTSKLTVADSIWILSWIVIGVIFGCCFFFGFKDNGYAFFAALPFVILDVVGLIKIKGYRLWRRIWLWIRYTFHKKTYNINEVLDSKLAFVEATPYEPEKKRKGGVYINPDENKINNNQRLIGLSNSFDYANGSFVGYLKVEAPKAYSNSFNKPTSDDQNTSLGLRLIENFNAVLTNWLNINNEKRGVSFSLTTFEVNNVNTSEVEKQYQEHRSKESNFTKRLINKQTEAIIHSNFTLMDSQHEKDSYSRGEREFDLKTRYYIFAVRSKSINTWKRTMEAFKQDLNDVFAGAGIGVGKVEELTKWDFNMLMNMWSLGKFNGEQQPAAVNLHLSKMVKGKQTEVPLKAAQYNLVADLKTENAHGTLDVIKNINEHRDHLVIEYFNAANQKNTEKYVSVISFKGYPDKFPIGWMSQIQSEKTVMISHQCYMAKQTELNNKLRKKMLENNKLFMTLNDDKNSTIYDANNKQLTLQQSLAYQEALETKRITQFSYNCYILIQSDTKNGLIANRNSVMDDIIHTLGVKRSNIDLFPYQQLQAYKAVFPSGFDPLRKKYDHDDYIPSIAFAQGWPFSNDTFSLKSNRQLFIGMDLNTGGVFSINPFNASSFSWLMFGVTGAGKSMANVCNIARSLSCMRNNYHYIIIDPNKDYISLTKQFGGINVNLSAGTTKTPILAETFEKDHIALCSKGLSTLLQLKIAGESVIVKEQLYEKGTDKEFIDIVNTALTPEKFTARLRELNAFSQADSEILQQLYTKLYQKIVSAWLMNPFHIVNVSDLDSDSKGNIQSPSTYQIYNDYKSSLISFFHTLLNNLNQVQSAIIDEAITKTYERKQIYVITQNGRNILSRNSSASGEISEEQLKTLKFPVMNDFYFALKELCEKKVELMRQADLKNGVSQLGAESVMNKTYYEQLLKALKPYVIDENGTIGAYATLFNSDENHIDWDNCIINFYVGSQAEKIAAKSVQNAKNGAQLNPMVSSDEFTTASAQLYLIFNIYRSFEVKNKLINSSLSKADAGYYSLIVDEAHNFLADLEIQKLLTKIYKEGRKYRAFCTLLTQDIGDLPSQQIISNTAFMIILRSQGPGAKDVINLFKDSAYPMSNMEKQFLVNPNNYAIDNVNASSTPGCATFVRDSTFRQSIRFMSTELEQAITGSDLFPGGVSLSVLVKCAQADKMPPCTKKEYQGHKMSEFLNWREYRKVILETYQEWKQQLALNGNSIEASNVEFAARLQEIDHTAKNTGYFANKMAKQMRKAKEKANN